MRGRLGDYAELMQQLSFAAPLTRQHTSTSTLTPRRHDDYVMALALPSRLRLCPQTRIAT